METMLVVTPDSGNFSYDVSCKSLSASLCGYEGSSCHFYLTPGLSLGEMSDWRFLLTVFRVKKSRLPYDKGKWLSSWLAVDIGRPLDDGNLSCFYTSCWSGQRAYQGKDFAGAYGKVWDAGFFAKASLGKVDAQQWCDMVSAVESLSKSALDPFQLPLGSGQSVQGYVTALLHTWMDR